MPDTRTSRNCSRPNAFGQMGFLTPGRCANSSKRLRLVGFAASLTTPLWSEFFPPRLWSISLSRIFRRSFRMAHIEQEVRQFVIDNFIFDQGNGHFSDD